MAKLVFQHLFSITLQFVINIALCILSLIKMPLASKQQQKNELTQLRSLKADNTIISAKLLGYPPLNPCLNKDIRKDL